MAIEQEDRIIETLFARHAADGKTVLLGPGDDAAIVRCPPGEELSITTDTLNEGVHFPCGTPAGSIGHRSLAVSLSDLAAMAARPLWAVVSLSVPSADETWLKEFADGLFRVAERFGCRVVGGDFVRGPLNVTVAAHGAAQKGRALRRSGASSGDGIWVSGFLGDAAAGLEILEHSLGTKASSPSTRAGTPSFPGGKEAAALIHRFCYPEPRVPLGRALAGIASSCMDLSDGLMIDLPRLLRRNQLQAKVRAEDLPISQAVRDYVDQDDSCRLALTGGDDYELCFTVPPSSEHRLESLGEEPALTRIGELHHGEGLQVTRGGRAWEPSSSGFRHFS